MLFFIYGVCMTFFSRNILFFPLFFITLLLQNHYADLRFITFEKNPDCPWCENGDIGSNLTYIPINTSFARFFAPADSNFIADLLWLRTAYYFGEHALTDQKFPYLFYLLDLITDISPSWIDPYLFGSVILPVEAESVEEGIYLIEKGIANHPDNWRLWFFKGFYQWQFKNDKSAASKSIHKASLLPGAPPFIISLASTFALEAGEKELAITFLKEALKHINDPEQRHQILLKLQKVIKGE